VFQVKLAHYPSIYRSNEFKFQTTTFRYWYCFVFCKDGAV